jgi:hypothetical protein
VLPGSNRGSPTLTGAYPSSEIPLALATLVVSVLAILGYLYVGWRLSQRVVAPGARLASWQFSIWWTGLGIALIVGRIELALAMVNSLSFPLALTFSVVELVIECVYLWGLVGWVLYVYAGKYYLLGLSAVYATFYVILSYTTFAQMPASVNVALGVTTIVYTAPESSHVALAVELITLVPETVGACVYLSLLYRSRDRTVRYRTVLVGSSILIWVAIHAFVPSTTIDWLLLKTVLEVLPAFLSLIAVIPPPWIRRRFGIEATQVSKVPVGGSAWTGGERPVAEASVP